MHILRRLGSRLAWSFFLILLFLFVLLSGIVLVVGNPAKVKGIIRRSGVYQSVIGSVLQQSQQTNGGGSPIGSVPLDRPEVQAALRRAFPPVLLQTQSEAAIDSTYRWLEGKTPALDIRIDLTEAKTTFAANLGAYLNQRLSTLPRCPLSVSPTTFDAFTATCLPPEVSVASTAQTVEHAISNSPEFLPNPIIATGTLLNTNGEPAAQRLRKVPPAYQAVIRLPLILGSVVIALAAVVVGAAVDRRKAVHQLGIGLVVSGGFWIVSALALDHLFQHFTSSLTRPDSTALNNELTKVLNLTNTALNHEYLIFGSVLAALGALALLAIHFFWQQREVLESPPAPNLETSQISPTPDIKIVPRKKVNGQDS
jgi:hypothetical protein